jgi:preprotein translocase subunit YajC
MINEAQAQSLGGFSEMGLMNFLPFILILVVMYFFVFRPQSKRAKEHRDMLGALKRGDKVIVAGGIFGNIVRVSDQEVILEVSKGVEVTAVKSSISQVLNKTVTPAEKSPASQAPVKKKVMPKKPAKK